MPAWDTAKPFHALAVVAAIARDAGADVTAHDLNIDFFHAVDPAEQESWSEANNRFWLGRDLPRSLWKKHHKWFTQRLDAIVETQPDLVAFSVNMSTRHMSILAAKYIRRKLPKTPILFGGVDCFPGEGNLNLFLKPRRRHYCNIICQGESEIALPKFLDEFARTGDVHTSVPGFAYYRNGKLVNTGDTELPSLKEDLPVPAYEQFDLSTYTTKGALPFFLTRGCVYRCNFCSERPNFRSFRSRRPEEAFAELQAILPHALPYAKVPTLSLADSNLNANPKMLREFVDLLLQSGIKIKWGGQAHFQEQMTREALEKMAQAGFVSVFWGLETGSQHVVDLMNKMYDQEDARRILRTCDELGIRQVLPIILGYPGEQPGDVVDTIDLILEYKDRPNFKIGLPNLIVVRPNSPLYDSWQDHGLANQNYYDWSTVDGDNTLPVRIARRFVVRQAHSNPSLGVDELTDTEELANIHLNEDPVGRDTFAILAELFTRPGKLDEFHRLLDTWAQQTQTSAPAADAESPYQDLWLRLNKDSADGRQRWIQLVLAGLKTFKEFVDARVLAAVG